MKMKAYKSMLKWNYILKTYIEQMDTSSSYITQYNLLQDLFERIFRVC